MKFRVKVHFGVDVMPRLLRQEFDTLEAALKEGRAYTSDSKGVWIVKPDGSEITVKEPSNV